MAGWSRVGDGSVLDCAKTPRSRRFKPNGFWVQLDLARPESGCGVERKRVVEATGGAENDKYRCWFESLLGFFLKEICTATSYRSIPPMLGDERYVDLFKLFLAVRERGGYDAVSRDGLWDSVTEKTGLSCKSSPAVKLVYCKYLQVLEGWLVRTVENKGSGLSEGLVVLEEEFQGFLSVISDLKKKDEEHLHLDVTMNSDDKSVDPEGALGLDDDSVKPEDGNEVENVMGDQDGAEESDDVTVLDPSKVEKGKLGSKRKRENIRALLNWVNGIAKNPCDSVVRRLPERSKWKTCAGDAPWKQILLAREAMLQERGAGSNVEHLFLQKGQKMHPSMYDTHRGSTYNLRERSKGRWKPSEGAPSEGQPSSEPSARRDFEITGIGYIDMLDFPERKRIGVGPTFQAELPVRNKAAYESDSKWLGNKVWPLEKTEDMLLVVRDRIGKGRLTSCSCQAPGSFECVNFHTAEKREKVKLELGSAFDHWKFDHMGEEVGHGWEDAEQKKFDSIVKANPASLGKRFWDHLLESFPAKGRANLVSYYFNVFLLRRRGFQNRATTPEINSDDDGSGTSRLRRPGSILYSPKKPRSSSR